MSVSLKTNNVIRKIIYFFICVLWIGMGSVCAENLGWLVLPFVENVGQVEKNVAYYARFGRGIVYVTTQGELLYDVFSEKAGFVLRERFVEGNVLKVSGEDKAKTVVNYFIGKDEKRWKVGVGTYKSVKLDKVWDGVAVRLVASADGIEKLFLLDRAERIGLIKIAFDGVKKIHIDKAGNLVVEAGLGKILFSKPVAYQKIGGELKEVKVSYNLLGGNLYGFKLIGSYDPYSPLVIDPLVDATFIGGSDGDFAYNIVEGKDGSIFIAGYTKSADFPKKIGAYDYTYNADFDAFVARLSSDLSDILDVTFIGGSDVDTAFPLALDNQGNVYVVGYTQSSDFPTTTGAFSTFYSGNRDVYVAKLSNSLDKLLASTFLGGSEADNVYYSFVIDSDGYVYVVGSTASKDFPVTDNAYDKTYNGYYWSMVFVSKLNSDLSELVASTFVGGSYYDMAMSIDIDKDGYVYVTGTTDSYDFPVTYGTYDTVKNGGRDIFIIKLDKNLSSLIASTFLGGSGDEHFARLTVGPDGYIYVAGITESNDFPVNNGYDESHNGGKDAFLCKFDKDLKQLLASTFLGGSDDELLRGLLVSSEGSVYVSGHTSSYDFPATTGAYDTDYNGGIRDIFLSKFDSSLNKLVASTFIGGSDDDCGFGIIIDSNGYILMVGNTYSDDFPVTSGTYSQENKGNSDVFVLRITSDLSHNVAPYIVDFVANPVSGYAPLDVVFYCSAQDTDGVISYYKWDFDGDGSYDFITYEGVANYTYVSPGVYEVSCVAVDQYGAEDIKKLDVEVNYYVQNQYPQLQEEPVQEEPEEKPVQEEPEEKPTQEEQTQNISEPQEQQSSSSGGSFSCMMVSSRAGVSWDFVLMLIAIIAPVAVRRGKS